MGWPKVILNTVGRRLRSPVYCVPFHCERTPVRDVPKQTITRTRAARAYRTLGADRVTFARCSAINPDRVAVA